MRTVWLCMPSKRPAHEAQPIIDKWRDMGYGVALQRDRGDDLLQCELSSVRAYSGYPEAATHLIHEVMRQDEFAQWFVCAGDDITPDPRKRADEIARECNAHFYNQMECIYPPDRPKWSFGGPYYEGGFGINAGSYRALATFGVMQPTGDRWGEGDRGKGKEHEAHIDCIAGSPWIGREFARRMYGGRGPYWTEYFHMFDDEELQCVATMLGVFWQRKDITQYHNHCQRDGGKAPAFLARAYGRENWNRSKAMFLDRKKNGFPGHEPIL